MDYEIIGPGEGGIVTLPPIVLYLGRLKRVRGLTLQIEGWSLRERELKVHYCLEIRASRRLINYRARRTYCVMLKSLAAQLILKNQSWKLRGHVLRIYPVLEIVSGEPQISTSVALPDHDVFFIMRHATFEV